MSKYQVLSWNDRLAIGLPEIDTEHRQLVELIDRLILNRLAQQQTDADAGTEQFRTQLGELKDHAVAHFQNEEHMMQRYAVREAHRHLHIKAHQGFVDYLERLGELANSHPDDIVDHLLTLLAEWLMFHIDSVDRSLAKGIIALRAGIPPTLAMAEENAFEGSLVDTMSTLYESLGKRTMEMDEANSRLHESEKHFRSLIIHASIPMAVNSKTGVIEMLNDKFVETFGYTLEDIPNLDAWWPRAYPDVSYRKKIAAEWQATADKAIRDGTDIAPMEANITCKEGSVRTAMVGGSFIADHFMVAFNDITERKQAEEAIRESENKFSKVFHTSPVGIGISRISDGKFIDANEAFLHIYGYTRKETIGHTSNELGLWADPEHRNVVISMAIQLGKLKNLEIEFKRKSGETGTQLVSVDTVEIAGELCLLTLITDVTARKRAEMLLKENQEQLLYLQDTSPIAVRITSAASGKVVFANRRYAKILNTVPDKLIGVNTRQYYVNPTEYDDIHQRLAEGLPVINKLIQLRLPSSESVWEYASYYPMEYKAEPAVLGWFYDVTELRHANEELQLASLVYQNSSEAMMVTDANGTILTINPAFTELTGYTEQEVFGQNSRILNSGHHGQAFFHSMWHDINTTGRWQGEIWNRCKNGEVFVEWLSINTIFNADGAVHRCVALLSDITERKAKEERMRHLARYDALTDLPNRTLLNDRLHQSLAQAKRDKSRIAVMFLDLDEFKPVNDTLGHEIGDLLLKEVAQRLLECCVRETDTVSRLGGDEFVVLLPGIAHASDTSVVAEKILAALNQPFKIGRHRLRISCSIGAAIFPEHGVTEKQLLNNADTAMYYAKKCGRNTVKFFQPEMLNTTGKVPDSHKF